MIKSAVFIARFFQSNQLICKKARSKSVLEATTRLSAYVYNFLAKQKFDFEQHNNYEGQGC